MANGWLGPVSPRAERHVPPWRYVGLEPRPALATPVQPAPAFDSGVARPSIILISIDTLRADRLGCYGAERATSPAIDALADDAIVFEHAVTPLPKTTPALASMLTGLQPRNHGVQDVPGHVDSALPLLAEMLRDEDYATAGVCGQHNCAPHYGFARGFDRYDAAFEVPGPDTSADRSGGGFHASSERRAQDIVRSALSWLQEPERGEPFFLWLHFMDPHAGYVPPEPFASRYDGVAPRAKDIFPKRPVPPTRPIHAQAEVEGVRDLAFYLNRYDGEVAYVDSQLARLFTHLKQSGRYRDSAILLTADHGEYMGEGSGARTLFTHGGTLHESEVRVPLIIKLPGNALAGRRDATLASLSDITPTVLDLAGAPLRPALDGLSLLRDGERTAQIIQLPDGGWLPHSERPNEVEAAMRTRTTKVVLRFNRSALHGVADGQRVSARATAYDLVHDPSERSNIARWRADDVQRATNLLSAWLSRPPRPAVDAPTTELDPVMRSHLRALGYVE